MPVSDHKTIKQYGENVRRILDIVIPVYNDNDNISILLKSIFKQNLPPDWHFRVYIVDDFSDVPVKLKIPVEHQGDVSLSRFKKNLGCSVARNFGAAAGKGEVILFLDADSSLAHRNVLNLLLHKYVNGLDVCFGQIYSPQTDFWARYQNDIAVRRAQSFLAGDKSVMTTIIFMVKRTVFEDMGGFDSRYHFGFEDRDLFLELIKSGANIEMEPEALVYHHDKLSLISVATKMYNSGAKSSSLFIKKHPKEYLQMPYSKVDVRYSKLRLGVLVFLTKSILWPLVRLIDGIIKKKFLPYSFKRKLVKSVSGLAYLHGTAIAKKSVE